MNCKEIEKKYLPKEKLEGNEWKCNQIVYQWYLINEPSKSEKIKIIFDFEKKKVIYVKVIKTKITEGINEKSITYLDTKFINVHDYIGFPFILKRRYINNTIFLDKFIRSNGLTEYLYEIEGETKDEVILSNCLDVTNDSRFYNQNMCTIFEMDDYEKLLFLLKIWE